MRLLPTGQPEQHPLEHRLAREGRILKGWVGFQQDFPPADRADPRMRHGHATVPDVHLAVFHAVSDGCAVRVMLTLRSDEALHLGCHEVLQGLQAHPHR